VENEEVISGWVEEVFLQEEREVTEGGLELIFGFRKLFNPNNIQM
jgi:hypothetical protein